MTDHPPYPLRVLARRDAPLSRWLWITKIVLVLPHVVLLSLLWIAEIGVVLVAAASVAVTGRQPRPLFDYSVGLLRWTWRVSYYSVGGFATDRYPPFSFASDPSYPCDLDVPYPGRQSRRLSFGRWILAIPQLVIVGALAGGWGFHTEGLISVLAIIGAFILAFDGDYPESLRELVVALQRWAFRVGAYVLVLTDEYPPFHLDHGADAPPVSI